VLLQGKSAIPGVAKWQNWLSKDISSDVASIEVEAVFKSHSSLCLLILPIAVWDMAKQNEAFCFIAYVESNNLLNTDTFHAINSGVLGGGLASE
jgi:hypothetical protein